MQSDLCWGAEQQRGSSISQSLCCVPGKAGLALRPQKCCKSRTFACREKPRCTDMWLEQVSTAGLSTEGFVQVSYTPFQEWDILIL